MGTLSHRLKKLHLIWTWLRRGNLKKEGDFLSIAAQNNATRTIYVKVEIDNTQKHSKGRV